MMLPYTIDVFFAAMARYNADHAGLVALLAGLNMAVFAGALLGTRAPWQDRAVGGVLAAGALMCGWAHQSQMMADLNFMAGVYGPVWVVQGGLLAGTLALKPRLGFAAPMDRARTGGLAIAAVGLIGYPLVLVAVGVGPDSLPLAGSAPDATAILIAGLLASAQGPRWLRLGLMLVPLGWGGVAATSAYLLGFPPDAVVPVAVLAAAALTLADGRG